MKAFFVAVCVLALAVCTVAAEKLGDWQNLSQVRGGSTQERILPSKPAVWRPLA